MDYVRQVNINNVKLKAAHKKSVLTELFQAVLNFRWSANEFQASKNSFSGFCGIKNGCVAEQSQ